MTGFKLIAIRPLKDCAPKYLKVLKANQIYKFYQNYEFSLKGENIESIECLEKIPANFYYEKIGDDKLESINISALAGKNGTGKSSLVELLIAFVYYISNKYGILDRSFDKTDENLSKLNNDKHQIELKKISQKERILEEYHKIISNSVDGDANSFIFELLEKGVLIENNKYNDLKNEILEIEEEIEFINELKNAFLILEKELKVEIFYEINNEVHSIKINDGLEFLKFEKQGENLTKWIEPKVNKNFVLELNFFYSIVLNYSHYSLNSKEIGIWILELFHKNDGYQTPMVINPMRTEGKIDINIENHLVKSRLLSLILEPITTDPQNTQRNLAGNKTAFKIKINIKNDIQEKYTNLALWSLIEDKFLNDNVNKNRSSTIWDNAAKHYIFYKLTSIAIKYKPYKKFLSDGLIDESIFSEYLNDIAADESHITFKFYQAINFLKYDYAKDYALAQTLKLIDEIANNFSQDTYQNIELITLVPPSFLSVDIIFSETDDGNSFNHLSSGEKQKIYSISSLIYHLVYLDSVNKRKELKIKYTNVNIVFDEIELYYHPELQRTFVFDFINSVKRIKFKSITGINCLFITHSPFILSDIPNQNVLLLDIDNSQMPVVSIPSYHSGQTFGANIHDLLANDFFLENGFMGEFAKNKINEVISFLTYNNLKKEEQSEDKIIKQSAKVSLKEFEFKSKYFDNIDKKDFLEIINIIAEPVLKGKLLEMYDREFTVNNNKENIQKEIDRLTRILNSN